MRELEKLFRDYKLNTKDLKSESNVKKLSRIKKFLREREKDIDEWIDDRFPYWSSKDNEILEELQKNINNDIKRIEKAEQELIGADFESTKDIEFSDLSNRLNSINFARITKAEMNSFIKKYENDTKRMYSIKREIKELSKYPRKNKDEIEQKKLKLEKLTAKLDKNKSIYYEYQERLMPYRNYKYMGMTEYSLEDEHNDLVELKADAKKFMDKNDCKIVIDTDSNDITIYANEPEIIKKAYLKVLCDNDMKTFEMSDWAYMENKPKSNIIWFN